MRLKGTSDNASGDACGTFRAYMSAAHFWQGLTRKPRLRHNKQDCSAANRLDLPPEAAELFTGRRAAE